MSLLGDWCKRSIQARNLDNLGTQMVLRDALEETDERITRLEQELQKRDDPSRVSEP